MQDSVFVESAWAGGKICTLCPEEKGSQLCVLHQLPDYFAEHEHVQ